MVKIEFNERQEVASTLQKYFNIHLRQSEDPPFPFSALDLLDKAARLPIIQLQSTQLGNPESIVVGTLFAKRYSVFAMGLIAAISLKDCELASSLDIVRFRVTNGAAMEYQTELASSYLLPVLDLEERRAKVNDAIRSLQWNLQQLFLSVSAHTGASVKVMWSLVSHNMQNLYARFVADRSFWETDERRRLIMADRETVFEPWKGNLLALKLRSYQHPQLLRPPFYLRRHCCLAYKSRQSGKEHGYCSTCPKLSPEERLQILTL